MRYEPAEATLWLAEAAILEKVTPYLKIQTFCATIPLFDTALCEDFDVILGHKLQSCAELWCYMGSLLL